MKLSHIKRSVLSLLVFLSLGSWAAPSITDVTGPYIISFSMGNTGQMNKLESKITQGNYPDRVTLEFSISVPPLGSVDVNASARYAEGILTLYNNDLAISNSTLTGVSVSIGHRQGTDASMETVESISAEWTGNGFSFDPDDYLILKTPIFTVEACNLKMSRIDEEKPTCKFVGSLPGNGAVVESLSEIITYWHRIDERVVVVNRPMPLYNGNNEPVSTGRLENTSDTTCVITFDPIIKTPGNYRVVIPEGTVTTRTGEALNSEATLHFTIADLNFIPNIEALPDDYTLSFVMEPNGNLSDIHTTIERSEGSDALIVNFPIFIAGQQCNLAIPASYSQGKLTMSHKENEFIPSPVGSLSIGFYHWKDGHSTTEYVESISANWNGFGFTFNPDDCISVKPAENPAISYLFADYLSLAKVNKTVYKCSKVSFDYDGRYLDVTGNGLFDAIYYTLDPNVDPINGILFEKPFDIGGINATVRAIAVKDGYDPSDSNEFIPNAYGIEGEAWVKENTTLQAAYYWLSREQQKKGWPSLTVHGWIDELSYGFMQYLTDLRHLDLSDAVSTSIPEFGFKSTGIVSISLPKELKSIASNAFFNSQNLCSLIWNTQSDVTAEISAALKTGLAGKGILFYIDGFDYSNDDNSLHVIKDGMAANPIILNDTNAWYAPRGFRAKHISFVKKFSKKTSIDGCSGWETISLPFEVEDIHFGSDLIYPFGNSSGDELSKRFWLYRTDGGWQPQESIQAYVPYLIAMPNNEAYYAPYNIVGDVTFSAADATIATSPAKDGDTFTSGLYFYPNFLKGQANEDMMLVNDDVVDGNKPGSIFIIGNRDIKPYEAYLSGGSVNRISIMESALAVDEVSYSTPKIWSEDNSIHIFSPLRMDVPVFDISGRSVAMVSVMPNETRIINGLSSGIYIVANKKIFVK